VRTLLAAFLLLTSVASGWDDPWIVADRDELIRLYQTIASAEDPRWLRDAKEIRRVYERGEFVEGVRARDEVHGVALRRGNRTDTRAVGKPSRATVRVTRKGCGIYLVLCGFDAIDWRIEVDKGVDLKKVLVYGKAPQRIRGVVPSKVVHRDRVFVLNHREQEYPRFATLVGRTVPGRKLHTYVGQVDPDNRDLVVGKENGAWRRQMMLGAMRRLEFRAMAQRRARDLRAATGTVYPMIVWARGGTRWFCKATAAGLVENTMIPSPRAAFSVAVDPESGRRFFLDNSQIREFSATGTQLRAIRLPSWIGRAGWAADIVYDGRRRRLVVVSMMGQLGEYPLAEREWRSLGERFTPGAAMRFRGWGRFGILTAMTWDARRDCFWGLYVNGGTLRLRRFSAHGDAAENARSFRLPVKVQSGPRNGVVLRMIGDRLVIFTVDWAGRKRRATSQSFIVDPKTGRVTQQQKLRQFPLLPAPMTGDLPMLWSDLNGPDCYSALCRLGRGGDNVVEFLHSEWNKLPILDEKVFRDALVDLDSPDTGLRIHAAARLAGAGPAMRGALAEAIESEQSPEVRMTLGWLLEEIDRGPNLMARLERILDAIATRKAKEFRAVLRRPMSRR